jgi:hypothetical protein
VIGLGYTPSFIARVLVTLAVLTATAALVWWWLP